LADGGPVLIDHTFPRQPIPEDAGENLPPQFRFIYNSSHYNPLAPTVRIIAFGPVPPPLGIKALAGLLLC